MENFSSPSLFPFLPPGETWKNQWVSPVQFSLQNVFKIQSQNITVILVSSVSDIKAVLANQRIGRIYFYYAKGMAILILTL